MQGEWTTGHRIADISTNDENLVSIDFDDDVAVTGVVAALLMVEIDARPSDAIAVAVTCDPPLPIYVTEEVLNDVLGE